MVIGRVVATDGTPLPGATLDVWQANDHGAYDVQEPDKQPDGNGRGLFTTDAEGRFWFRTIVPSYYPIPTDGPVGELLAATRRHPYRPAHIHFIVAADGYRTLTTHIFVGDSEYIDSDAVFAVKKSLITEFVEVDDPEQAERYQVSNPFRLADVQIALSRTNDTRRTDDTGEGLTVLPGQVRPVDVGGYGTDAVGHGVFPLPAAGRRLHGDVAGR